MGNFSIPNCFLAKKNYDPWDVPPLTKYGKNHQVPLENLPLGMSIPAHK